MMATAGKVTIAEVEELVEPGQLDPDAIHTPGIFVAAASCRAAITQKTHRTGVTTRPRPEEGAV